MTQIGQTKAPLRTLHGWRRRAESIQSRAEKLMRDMLTEADDFSDGADNVVSYAEDLVDLLRREIEARKSR